MDKSIFRRFSLLALALAALLALAPAAAWEEPGGDWDNPEIVDPFRRYDDAQMTAEMFDLLLGDNLAGRKDYIADNGYLYMDDIDLS